MIDLIDQTPVDLKALRALVAVADQGSFRAAARSLGYTQSAISHQIGDAGAQPLRRRCSRARAGAAPSP